MATLKAKPLNWTDVIIWDPTTWGAVNTPKILFDEIITEEPPKLKTKVEPIQDKTKKIGDLYKYKKLSTYEGLLGKKQVRAPTTYVGVEIELERVSHEQTPSSWKETEDGSLKEAGLEFVSNPIPVKYLEVELERLFSSLNNYTASIRCSVHVHINVRDFTIEELEKFLMLYLIFERSLYRFSGDRWDNNFCVPLRFYDVPIQRMISHLKTGIIYEEWYKYFGLNLSPIFGGESSKIGTIEFRHMKGTGDIEHILNWVNLIVSLKIAAKMITYDDLVYNISVMNTTSSYYQLANYVFKFCAPLIVEQPTFKSDVEECVAYLKSLCTKNKEIEEIIPLIGV